ncbi:hypothetical protein PV11_08303 [Exophiala sideris]|uniref:Major facilitator superfamily (MFS) profile domain-containing protein n=1 Tax=Exophiala sideris TaxID=1016849 RepID=A0A0D1YCW8_9EURO|nr:hypothetical protein PV11_08303 [Exophiala sideris]
MAPEPLTLEEGRSQRGQYRIFALLSVLYAALFISAVNTTIITTALPTIAKHFHSTTGYTWVGAAYVLADTASGPVWTNFSDIWGRKIIFLVAIALFMVSSLICGLSTSMVMLIAGRALQGAAAGGIMLLVTVVISDMFDMRRRTLYLGICEVIWAISGAVGPIIGGAFAEYTSWRWIWYTNLPITAVIFLVVCLFMDVHNPKTPIWPGLKAVDWLGSMALLAVTLMTLLGLNFGGDSTDWTSPKVLVLIIVGVALSAVFFLIEAKLAKYPIMPLHVFRNRSNAATIAVATLHAFAMMGPEFYLPLYFQSAKLARPLRSGLLGLPFVFLEGTGGIIGGLIIHRTGRYNTLLWVGAASMTLGFGLLIDLKSSTDLVKIIIYQSVGALGSGILIQPPMIAIQANVPQQETASATSTLQFMRGLAEAVSIVIGGVVFQSSMDIKQTELLKEGLPHDVAVIFSGQDAQVNVDQLQTMHNLAQQHLVQEAYAWSLRNAWILYAAVAGLTIVASYFVGTHALSTEHVETRTGLDERDSKK